MPRPADRLPGPAGRRPDAPRGPGTVHIHLEHRVSQRLLGRFLAQGFVHHDLSRACLAQSKESLRMVFLLARLSLFGRHATRLHEDIRGVFARVAEGPDGYRLVLDDPQLPDHDAAFARLDEALLAPQSGKLSPDLENRLLAQANDHIRTLLPPLLNLIDGDRKQLERDLKATGKKEAERMTALLESQKKHILKSLDEHEKKDELLREKARKRQSETLFDTGEPGEVLEEKVRRERLAERRAMTKRLADIERELLEEPGRIRERFQIQNARIDPVGIVYLWPERG